MATAEIKVTIKVDGLPDTVKELNEFIKEIEQKEYVKHLLGIPSVFLKDRLKSGNYELVSGSDLQNIRLNDGTTVCRCISCDEDYKPRLYVPACPYGNTDCIYDPAYIKTHSARTYEEMYGDKTPEEAIKVGKCCKYYKEDNKECPEYEFNL